MHTPGKESLIKACVDLLRRASNLPPGQVEHGEEVAKAIKHIDLADQYLSQISTSSDHAGGVSKSAIDQIARRQLTDREDGDDYWPALWTDEDEIPTGESTQIEEAEVPELESFDPGYEDVAGFELFESRQGLEGDNSTISISDLVSWFSIQERDGVLRVRIPTRP